MTADTIEQSQRTAARAVGVAYLITNALAYFAEFHVRAKLIDHGSAQRTVENIVASEQLFRLGLAADLLTFAGDVVLAVGMYLILRSVNRGLAMLGAAWRLVETAIVAVMALNTFDVLRLMSDKNYLHAFEPARVQAMVGMALNAHDAGYNVSFLFFGLGSTAFCCLWFQSRYIPRALAVWGILGAVLAAASTFIYTLSPDLAKIVEPAIFIPIGTFELILGFWLVVKGLPHANPGDQAARL